MRINKIKEYRPQCARLWQTLREEQLQGKTVSTEWKLDRHENRYGKHMKNGHNMRWRSNLNLAWYVKHNSSLGGYIRRFPTRNAAARSNNSPNSLSASGA